MGFQDVALLPSRASFHTTLAKIVREEGLMTST